MIFYLNMEWLNYHWKKWIFNPKKRQKKLVCFQFLFLVPVKKKLITSWWKFGNSYISPDTVMEERNGHWGFWQKFQEILPYLLSHTLFSCLNQSFFIQKVFFPPSFSMSSQREITHKMHFCFRKCIHHQMECATANGRRGAVHPNRTLPSALRSPCGELKKNIQKNY